MTLKHLGFLIFMIFLLITPKIPLEGICGVPGKSSVSLGIIGLFFWYLVYPKKRLHFSKPNFYSPVFWLISFAVYAFIVSLLSANTISIVYSVQYLLYVIIGAFLMKRYNPSFINTDYRQAYTILFTIAIIYAIGIITSIFTGPIYPHQVLATYGRWGGLIVPKGVGFSESQNLTGPVAIFFLAAGVYLYPNKTKKKMILVSLLLCALLATLSRGAIFSFFLALIFVYTLDCVEPLLYRAAVKVSVLKDIVFFVFVFCLLIIPIVLILWFFNKPVIAALLAGLGLKGSQYNVVSVDLASRFDIWVWGVNDWADGDLSKIVFGGGFRSSMEHISDRGTWKDAHNVYVTILGDFGIVGLVMFLIAICVALFRYVRLFLIGKAEYFEKFGLLALLGMSIDNLTGPYFYSPICLSLLIFIYTMPLSSVKKEVFQCSTTL